MYRPNNETMENLLEDVYHHIYYKITEDMTPALQVQIRFYTNEQSYKVNCGQLLLNVYWSPSHGLHVFCKGEHAVSEVSFDYHPCFAASFVRHYLQGVIESALWKDHVEEFRHMTYNISIVELDRDGETGEDEEDEPTPFQMANFW